MRIALALTMLPALMGPALAADVTLTGEVTYRERLALPAGASLRLQLVDESTPAVPPRLLASAPIAEGGVPLAFTLTLSDALLHPDHRYGLIATILVGDTPLFRNFDPALVRVADPPAPISIVTTLLQDLAAASDPSSTATDAAVPAEIYDVTWQLLSIAGQPVLPRATPTLSIDRDGRAGGSTGCNSWFAEARLTGETLVFGAVTATMRGCTQSINAQDVVFRRALSVVSSWKRQGDHLTLFAAGDQVLLDFGL